MRLQFERVGKTWPEPQSGLLEVGLRRPDFNLNKLTCKTKCETHVHMGHTIRTAADLVPCPWCSIPSEIRGAIPFSALGPAAGQEEDGDSNGDSNGNTNGDSNGNTNGDSNGNTNGDSNGNANGDSNGNTNGDSNGNTNGDSNGGSDDDSNADAGEFLHLSPVFV